MQRWKKTGEKLVYDGYRKVVRESFILPNGSPADFDVIKTNGAAAVLAITENNQVICFKQFRPGPEKVLYELPGGAIDAQEKPTETAQRELLEESGYEAELEYIGSYCRDAYVSGQWHMFVGRNAKKIRKQELEPTEFGDLVLLDVDKFKDKLFSGLTSDTTLGYAGLYHLGLL